MIRNLNITNGGTAMANCLYFGFWRDKKFQGEISIEIIRSN
jgi:hypothetical protein